MATDPECRQRVISTLEAFLRSTGREGVTLSDTTNLHADLGMASDEGLDLVLDLCEAFDFDFPHDFNPVVHESGRRGRRVGELIAAIEACLPKEVSR
ncbi:MAG: hypothetical protein KF724_12190 [Phycisphaeraceae bacterium]|nr:hypothetical protein [Phycisphaeraceae bacterium]